MAIPLKGEERCFGITTIGEKGQVVVPAAARKALKLSKGEKLLVFGMGHEMIVLAKISTIEQFASHLSKKLTTLKGALYKAKN